MTSIERIARGASWWLAGIGACGALLAQDTAEPVKKEPPPIVLITLASVRPDHLGCYGYFRDTSPNLDRIAGESVLFERAVTTMAAPVPALLSLFTGAYAHQHGIVDPLVVQLNPWRAPQGMRTVAALLAQDGYRTAALVSARQVGKSSGLDAGFASFDDPGATTRSGEEVTKLACAWLGEHAGERFFLWVQHRGALAPNLPAPACGAPFASDERLEALIGARGIDPERFKLGVSVNVLRRALFPEEMQLTRNKQGVQLPPLTLDAFRGLYNRYDGDLRCADRDLGVLVARLRELALWQRAIVVIVGDCAPALGEHTSLDSGDVTNENVLVPLLVHFPEGSGAQPSRVARMVSLVDVMPTVLARFDNTASASLLAQGAGRDALAPDFERNWAFAQRPERDKVVNDPGPTYALISERWKYVHRPELSDRLYDLEADPGELTDVLAKEPEIAAALKAELLAVAPAPAGAK